MLKVFDEPLIRFILRERHPSLSSYLIGRLRHALIFGAALNDVNKSTMKQVFWGGVAVTLIFSINAIAEIVAPTDPNRMTTLGINNGFFPQAIVALLFCLSLSIPYVSLLGHRNKEKIPEGASVVQVDLKAVAKSGGAWGAAGLGIAALIGVFFG